jgi:hypothetical protein
VKVLTWSVPVKIQKFLFGRLFIFFNVMKLMKQPSCGRSNGVQMLY